MAKWKYVDKKLKAAYGETDYEKKVVAIDRKAHKGMHTKKGKKRYQKQGLAKEDMTLLNTMVHEVMHSKRPKMTEKQVRKATRAKIKKITPKAKKRMYAKFK